MSMGVIGAPTRACWVARSSRAMTKRDVLWALAAVVIKTADQNLTRRRGILVRAPTRARWVPFPRLRRAGDDTLVQGLGGWRWRRCFHQFRRRSHLMTSDSSSAAWPGGAAISRARA